MAAACTFAAEAAGNSVALSSSTCPARWYAVEVRTTREKAVSSLLANKGFQVFQPLYMIRRQWSDRIKVLEAPLFPGYLFTRLVEGQRYLPLLTTPYVRSLVSVAGRPAPIPDEEIAAIQAVVASKLPATPWPYLHSGSRVRIVRGPLAGIEGILLNFKSQDRLILSIEMLQRSVAVEIDSAWAEPVLSSQNRTARCGRTVPVKDGKGNL